MTLPKIFSLASKNFNDFDTMSFETGSVSNSISYQEREQQQQQHVAQNQQQRQQVLSSLNSQNLIISSLPLIQTRTTIQMNTMFDANGNINADINLSPAQLNSDNQQSKLLVECVIPGIYLTKDFISWKEEQLRAHGFTHIIIIDKHIQELYYPNQQPDIFKLCSMNNEKTKSNGPRHDNSSSLNVFDYYCPPSSNKHLSFGKEFQVIDLNFGEKSYLITVLPNCYRAVKFINKALQDGGTILVIDCNGGEQKCLTIIVAYLMYKHNISFSNAFARLKEFYKKADLDRFYISQLYEYEPILQVQRAQSRGHSCSRELHAAILKRKKTHDDDDDTTSDNITICSTSDPLSLSCYVNTTTNTYTNATTTTTAELLNNCNPLNRFDSTQMERQEMKPPNHHHQNQSVTQDNRNRHTFTRFMSVTSSSSSSTSTSSSSSSSITTGGWYNWDDFAME